ncbi:MAG: T9SS type A sorting domain-containing protein [Flavobacteriia bacterium]|nr:T9SS type A sorting domain-containing protein [Flavobacteriia bacterium]
MKKTVLITVSLFLLFSSKINAQRNCGTMHHHEELLQQYPNLQIERDAIENFTQQVIKSGEYQKTVVNIPVVVHIVYNTTSQNISDAQIQSQIAILNKDFRKLNSDVSSTPSTFSSSVADCEINFCLASIDPNGAATNGIIRKATSVTSFIDDDKVKYSAQGGDDAWAASKYLNLWICNLGNGLLGYAQFPGGPAASDGVVINYTAFGNTGTATAPYNLGRTATHEIGHWLNLYHIGGDQSGGCGNDQVADTPTQKGGSTSNGTGNDYGQNFGCPTHPLVRSGECSGTTAEMFMNYMDYTDDGCMYMFTNGQKSRMQALFASGGSRASILSSNGCGGSSTPPAASYCNSSSSNTQYEWISNVNLGTINNTTASNNGYGNFTSLTTNLAIGSVNSIKLTPGFSGSAYSEYFRVFIDYNKDLDFEDAGELVYTSAATSTAITGTFTVPTAATIGTTRMRVMMKDAAITGSCEMFTYGEVEDYSVSIQAAAPVSCTDNYETNETKTAAKTITINTNITAKIGSSTDIDWFKFSNSTTAKNMKITLTNLPADYDLRLYNSSGTLLATSQNTGTTAETIVYNTSTVATYYIKVTGYSGANSSTCYTLKAATSSTTLRTDGSDIQVNDESIQALSELLLIPNPSNDGNVLLTLKNETIGKVTITILDASGRVMEQIDSEKEDAFYKKEINLNAVEGGVYFIQISGSNFKTIEKLIINK